MPGSIIHKPEADDDPLVGLYFDRSHSSTGTLTSLATSSARRLSQGLSLFASVRKAKAEEEEEEDHIFHSDSEEEKSGDILEARNGLSLQGPDALLAARWDHDLLDSSLVLTLVFRDGVQLWDCQRLATLRELAFVNSPEGADIACAQLLPSLTSNSSPRSSAWQHTPLLAYT